MISWRPPIVLLLRGLRLYNGNLAVAMEVARARKMTERGEIRDAAGSRRITPFPEISMLLQATAASGISAFPGMQQRFAVQPRFRPNRGFAASVLTVLEEKYAEAMRRDDVKAIVVSGDAGKFSGGFDINAFQKGHAIKNASVTPSTSVELFVNTIEDGRKPSVAAIQGLALGGGLELAMACHARIATPEAKLGLPELTLGFIPGLGGTQHLPRLIGMSKAIDMMLSSKSIMSEEGRVLGLIDAIVSPEELLMISRLWALDIADRRKPRISSLCRTDKLNALSELHEILTIARQQARKAAPNMPQHQACLDVIAEGVTFGGYAGVLKEAKVSKELSQSSVSKALVHVFFAQRATSKVPDITNIGLRPRHIGKIAVIGGGLMGSGIATALIASNIPVIFKESNSDYLRKGIRMITVNLQGQVARGLMTQNEAEKALPLLKGVLDYSEFKHVDMVIEAAVESIPLKQSTFGEIEKACPRHCILATNTSMINLNVFGEKTSSHDRIVGAHFFSPAHVMPLVEIVRTEKTSPQVILDLMTVVKTIKKVPIVVGNCTGFAVNRTFFPYTQGAHLLVNRGVDLFRIDRVITSFGMPMGPFQLQDLAGYGEAMASAEELSSAFPDRTFHSLLVKLMVQSGRNGKSNGNGYYIYEKGSKPKPDPTVQSIIEESRQHINFVPSEKSWPLSLSDQEIVEMILFPVVNEACRIIEEGLVVQASDLDIASILRMGFPSYRGGIIFWADSIGPGYIYSNLKRWSEAYGTFFKPSQFLEERAEKGIPLGMSTSVPRQLRERL